MKIHQSSWTTKSGWQPFNQQDLQQSNSLVFAFGERFKLQERFEELQGIYPNSDIILNSTR